jgi:hypothetical protein
MITTKDLESLGWVKKATAKNGGSKLFTKGEYFTIWSNADNFILAELNQQIIYKIKIIYENL